MTTIVRRETRKRGFFGWVFLILFMGFNALMLLWLIAYWGQIGSMASGNSAASAGAVIGGTIGTGLLLFVWVCGSVILGLLAMLTRGRRTIVEEISR